MFFWNVESWKKNMVSEKERKNSAAQLSSTLIIIRNINQIANQDVRMISEGSGE